MSGTEQTSETEQQTEQRLISRYTLRDVFTDPMFTKAEELQSLFWLAREIDPSHDSFDSIPKEEQYAVRRILMFFASADVLVMENVMRRTFKTPAATIFAGRQASNEIEHALAYDKLLKAYVPDPTEQETIFRAMLDLGPIKAKVAWVKQWLSGYNPEINEATRSVGFVVTEMLMFPASFAFIMWMREQYPTQLRAFYQMNQFVLRDETLHGQAWAWYVLNHHHSSECPPATVRQMIESATEIELAFVDDMLAQPMWGMSAARMKQYVRHVADQTMKMLGLPPIYGAHNPFHFMDRLKMRSREGIHEVTPTNYQDVRGSASH